MREELTLRLSEQLNGKVFAVAEIANGGTATVGIVVLEEQTASLYTVPDPWMKLTREVLHLRDATVKSSVAIKGGEMSDLVATLDDERVLTFMLPESDEDRRAVRDRLEGLAASTR
jgi:hypothetical protein